MGAAARILILSLAAGWAACAQPQATAAPDPPMDPGADSVAPLDESASVAQVDESLQAPTDAPGSGAPAPQASPGDPDPEPAWTADELHDPATPLPDGVRAVLSAIPDDPDPSEIIRNSHYWSSNENAQFLFRETIEDVGGVYVGVGMDQTYLLASWQRASVIIPMDFDRAIRNMHLVYGIFLQAADTPGVFHRMWHVDEEEAAIALIRQELAAHPLLEEIVDDYESGHGSIYRRLRRVEDDYDDLEIPSFMTDQDHYDYVRGMWANGRVIPLCGDLTGDDAMVGIAEALREVGLELGVLYTSNAEQYFDTGSSFRRNVIVQPWAENGWLIRTRPTARWAPSPDGEYHYQVQRGRNFALWMMYSGETDSGWEMLDEGDDTDTDGLSIINDLPDLTDDDEFPPDVGEFPEGWQPPSWLEL